MNCTWNECPAPPSIMIAFGALPDLTQAGTYCPEHAHIIFQAHRTGALSIGNRPTDDLISQAIL